MNRLYRLMAHGYLPKELPPLFSSVQFAKELNRNLAKINPLDKWTRASGIIYNQGPDYHRRLSIINPNSFFGLSKAIVDNYPSIMSMWHNKNDNCSIPAFNKKTKIQRAIRPYATGKSYTYKKLKLRGQFPYILKLDIQNYYKSVYTHSIPWAFIGKEVAKKKLKRGKGKTSPHYSDEIDKWVRNSQDGQTIGLPVGPDTSFIISEVIQSRLVKDLEDKKVLNYGCYIRYYDDFEIGINSKDEANSIIDKFENELNEYELQLNSNKTKIIQGLDGIESPWVHELKAIGKSREEIQRDELLNLAARIFDLEKNHKNDSVCKYFLQMMRSSLVSKDAWPTYESILLAILQTDNDNTKELSSQFAIYKTLGYRIDKSKIRDSINRKVRRGINGRPTTEISWCIYLLIILDIKPERDLLVEIVDKGDSISALTAFVAAKRFSIAIKKPLKGRMSQDYKSVLWGPEWLLNYELNLDYNITELSSELSGDPMFNLLFANGISFICPLEEIDDLLPRPYHAMLDGKTEETSKKSPSELLAELDKTISKSSLKSGKKEATFPVDDDDDDDDEPVIDDEGEETDFDPDGSDQGWW